MPIAFSPFFIHDRLSVFGTEKRPVNFAALPFKQNFCAFVCALPLFDIRFHFRIVDNVCVHTRTSVRKSPTRFFHIRNFPPDDFHVFRIRKHKTAERYALAVIFDFGIIGQFSGTQRFAHVAKIAVPFFAHRITGNGSKTLFRFVDVFKQRHRRFISVLIENQ